MPDRPPDQPRPAVPGHRAGRYSAPVTKLWKGVAEAVLKVARRVAAPKPATPTRTVPAQPRSAAPGPGGPRSTVHRPGPPPSATRPGGRYLEYSPRLDGDADPGEIVWTWVTYEDDPNQGKDRPVLVVGRNGRTLLGLMLSSQSERDGQRNWLALGPGDWDRDSRPSWVRLDRVLEVDEDGIRREGAVLDQTRFDTIAAELRGGYGWA